MPPPGFRFSIEKFTLMGAAWHEGKHDMRLLVFGPRNYPANPGVRQAYWLLDMLHGTWQKAEEQKDPDQRDNEFVIITGISHRYNKETQKSEAVGPDLWAAQWARDHRSIGVGLWALTIPKVDGWDSADEPGWYISNVGGWYGCNREGKRFKGNEAAYDRNLRLLVEGRPSHALGFMHGITDGTKLMFDILDEQRKHAPGLPRVRRRIITPDKELSWPFDWED